MTPKIFRNYPTFRYGEKIHLINQYQYGNKSYLDTCGMSSCSGQYFVQTSVSPDRHSGSGTWEIKSATGTKIGKLVKNGDKIHLMNQHGTKSYLDTCGSSIYASEKYALQTSISHNRKSGSGTWEIVLEGK